MRETKKREMEKKRRARLEKLEDIKSGTSAYVPDRMLESRKRNDPFYGKVTATLMPAGRRSVVVKFSMATGEREQPHIYRNA